ncbi:extradiol ring-cleavage dioxygenase [Allofranklinella schreckenbergeri]|uniref:Extradiol ring-cleavage dioxygenase n=2 Tax=Comamonadaceae TaxID=80864 RepID=A0A3M6R712_9BURK|nr:MULTISPECIES: extradiol ring-cleavage dioxygenase [Comamonadaceae]RRD41148.1 extradiol ring-cleavage dioxygenase [Comamonadaceae bacterium OH3737_COT-264]PAT32419.1 extradiol ring-cleavage dioxygenase [Vandammella animalimorsus]PAT36821.1 extradiol ring-cleavage dioxygenase [Vandammella animalimorsus]PAT42791.1 extradiol ring-cleavage dioxygenase [Vandammella animalimorsus]PAX16324.1 extradiol ring-cleavage dioxygenase [Vandammella animalimorsus]
MSRNVIERVLHQLTVDRSAKQRFREDADGYLARFALSEHERSLLKGFDVAALQQMGVNPMLTMGFWQELAPTRDMRQYMRALRPVADGEAVHVAAIKQ